MSVVYLDASAAMKLLFAEVESPAMRAYLDDDRERTLVSSWLLHAELHCAVGRRGRVAPEHLATVLAPVDLADVSRNDLLVAGTLTPLRSLDAIHLAAAMRLGVDEIITYDVELADAALRAGLRVSSPGL